MKPRHSRVKLDVHGPVPVRQHRSDRLVWAKPQTVNK